MAHKDEGLTVGDGEAHQEANPHGNGLLLDTKNAPSSQRPVTEPSSGFTDFVLSGLRVAHIHARLHLNAIESAGIALKAGIIDAESALAMLAEGGAANLFPELTRASS